LLRSSNPDLSAEDIVLGYKQLLEVERGWRDIKSTIELRRVYHHLEDRIRAHVVLCWLALLLIRIAETRTGLTWASLRREMQRVHQVEYDTTAGTLAACTKLTPAQRDILSKLGITPPPLVDLTANPQTLPD